MIILWEPQNKAMWHVDCSDSPHGGVVNPLEDDEINQRTIVKCLSCNTIGVVDFGISPNVEYSIKSFEGWYIQKNQKPIPDNRYDYDFWHDGHDGADGGNGLCGAAGSYSSAISAIEEIQDERD